MICIVFEFKRDMTSREELTGQDNPASTKSLVWLKIFMDRGFWFTP